MLVPKWYKCLYAVFPNEEGVNKHVRFKYPAEQMLEWRCGQHGIICSKKGGAAHQATGILSKE